MATLVIACPVCTQKIRAPANVLGRPVKCPQCKSGFTALDPAAVSDEPLTLAQPRPREVAPPAESAPPTDEPPAGLDADDAEDVPATVPARGAVVDYLAFRRMVTPAILTVLFYAGTAALLLTGLVGALALVIGAARGGMVWLGVLMLFVDFVVTVGAVVMWRVFCEVVITLFRILEELRALNARGG